ncbi:hypothetical protein N7462_011702 [Penicillium macrosclerotiorum]|uniref:uncharacterized protein n=1 Tax=Penicillium macrosclerotiorum TaxID=303699 RepID=UPI002547DA10|nr:uncharacterized protein N7462_011702 [Penicillium macrosclerotiorum]KAJ5662776.1 hypothetical protein N7462_011702 [Penicillium macrosclerotiorum]
MNSSESPFSNLDLWCDWSGDPNDPVEVYMSVESRIKRSSPNQIRCTPNANIAVLDTAHPSVIRIIDFSLAPKVARPDNIKLLHDSISDEESTPVTTGDDAKHPVTPDSKLSQDLLNAGVPDPVRDEVTPTSVVSDSGSVLVRAACTPDGSPRRRSLLDSFYSCIFVDSTNANLSLPPNLSTPETPLGESLSSSFNPRKRTAKAASLPDSISDSERAYYGSQIKNNPLETDRQSPVPSTSSKHSRRRSLIPRPINSLSQGHNRTEPSTPKLPGVSITPFEDDGQNFEGPVDFQTPYGINDNGNQSRYDRVGPGREILIPATPSKLNTSLNEGTGEEGKFLQDLEKLSTVASAGSPCDMKALSTESDTMSSVAISTEGVPLVQPSSPQRLFSTDDSDTCRPRLLLLDRVFYVQCPSTLQPEVYRATITFVLCLSNSRPRGWFELIVPGLPRLSTNDHGYFYFCTPPDQGMEFRTTHFKRYNLFQSCLMAQFLIPSKLVIPLRPCDAQFYGFLKDFKVAQAIHSDIYRIPNSPDLFKIRYHAVCSLDLIQRDFWAERCGFIIYVHGGPDGDFAASLQEPKSRFQTIPLDTGGGAATKVGISKVQVICTPTNLAMFALTWEVQLPHGKATAWMPRITASRGGSDAEIKLQDDYGKTKLESCQETVHVDYTSVEATTASALPSDMPSSSQLRPKSFSKSYPFRLLLGVFLIVLLYRSIYRANMHYDFVSRAQEILCAYPEASIIVATSDEDGAVSKTPSLPMTIPLRDRIDYLLGWQGPFPGAREG